MRLSRRVFEREKKELKALLGASDSRITELIKMNHEEALDATNGKLFAFTGNAIDYSKIDLFDDVWFYKRCLHLISNGNLNHDISEGVDTTPLAKLDKDVTLDVMIDGEEVFLRLQKRTYPVVVRDNRYYWTVNVYTDEDNILYSMSFGESEKTVKVLIHDNNKCSSCGVCHEVECGAYVRPRNRPFCVLEDVGLKPLELIAMLMDTISRYVNREKLSRKRSKPGEENPLHSIMVACEDTGSDTECILPMYSYVKEYEPSKPYVYKGGHHKSPVAHPRSGYFRRSRCGDHIMRDGEFIKVPKGMGQYTHVKPTLVNAGKDSVFAQIV